MANPTQQRNAAQKNAEQYFRRAEEQPATTGIRMGKRKRASAVTIASELRELRLAKAAAAAITDELTAEVAGTEPGSQRRRGPAARSVLKINC